MKADAEEIRMPFPNTFDAEDIKDFVEKLNNTCSDKAVWTYKREFYDGVESITITLTSKEKR